MGEEHAWAEGPPAAIVELSVVIPEGLPHLDRA